ncbi:UNVERIFIED_CONTAM: glutamate synthase, partial [Bacillus subtilis]
RVDDVEAALADFDAVFTAVGAQIGKNINVPAGSASHVMDAVDVLRDVEEDGFAANASQPLLGRVVVVYGGGNTAVDAARTAQRLGATASVILYRRTRDRMPAHDSEVQEAEEEGITMRWLSTVDHVDAGSIK